MSIMSPVDHRQMSSGDPYRTISDPAPSGFLTPPASSQDRRDSVASSYCQSFGSSEYSGSNDHSMPPTPTYGSSPSSDGVLVDGMSYELTQDFHSQVSHGLPLFAQRKEEMSTGELYDSCLGFQHGMQSPPHPPLTVHPLMSLHSPCGYGPVMNPHLNDFGVDPSAMSSSEPMWDNMSTVVWPDADRTHHQTMDRPEASSLQMYRSSVDQSRPVWEQPMTNPFEAAHSIHASEPTIHSDSALNIYVQMDAQIAHHSESVNNIEHMFPQTPQEVLFKREESVDGHGQVDVERSARRRGERMHVSQTGSKSVKRMQRPSKTSKSRAGHNETPFGHIAVPLTGSNNILQVTLKDNIDIECFRATGKAQLKGGLAKGKAQNPCEHVDPDTRRRCSRSFKRIEHLRRHMKTHSGAIEAKCELCPKTFGRNDNCFAHYSTHISQPGKKAGRNDKMPIFKLLKKIRNEKLREKLQQKHAALLEQELLENDWSDSDSN